MRRVAFIAVLGLGVFAVALGFLLRFYTYPAVAKAPLNPNMTSVSTGTDVTTLRVLDGPNGAKVPEISHGLTVTATRFVQGDLTRPEVTKDGDVAVWVEGVTLVDGSGNQFKATERAVCLDRRTNEATQPCSGQYVSTDQAKGREVVSQPGLSLKFPFNTGQQTYPVYDLLARRATDARFVGEETLDGLAVYRFVQDIQPIKIDERDVPGSLVGSTESSTRRELYYQNVRTMWVEPTTGAIIKGQEEQRQELRKAGENTGTAAFAGTLAFSAETVGKNIAAAKENTAKLWPLTTGPTLLWSVGGLLVVVGAILLIRLPRRGQVRVPAATPPVRHRSSYAR